MNKSSRAHSEGISSSTEKNRRRNQTTPKFFDTDKCKESDRGAARLIQKFLIIQENGAESAWISFMGKATTVVSSEEVA